MSSYDSQGSAGIIDVEKRQRDVQYTLGDPTVFPTEFLAWLKRYVEQSGIQLPASQIYGSRGPGVGSETDYVGVTSTLTVTATTDATANTFITGTSINYDGITKVRVEFYAPYIEIGNATAANVVINLYDGSTDLGRLANLSTVGDADPAIGPCFAARQIVPSNAAHQYSIRAWKTAGTAYVGAGAGGTATYLPAYLRIVRV